MKVKLTLSQFKKILRNNKIKYPINFKGTDFTKKEFSEFQQLLINKNDNIYETI
jgi:hypothetical protein